MPTATCGPCWSGSGDREVDPSFVISHRLPLDQAPEGSEMFRDKQDECTKVVLTP
jgi:threonine dehydrogenase-like Zn-dependent dehydrogenase